MKKLLLLALTILLLLFVRCKSTPDITLSTPPKIYIPNNITNNKQLLMEYRNSLMHISKWQHYYNIQVGSNYYQYKEIEK